MVRGEEEMRVIVGALIIILVLSIGASSSSSLSEEEHAGYDGLLWGDTPARNMVLEKDIGSTKVYSRPYDTKEIDCEGIKIPLVRTEYWFHKGGFRGIYQIFTGIQYFYLLRRTYFHNHSKKIPLQNSYAGGMSGLNISYDKKEREGYLAIYKVGME